MAYGNYAPYYRSNYFNTMPTMQAVPMNYQNQQQQPSMQGTVSVQNQVQNPIVNDVIWVQGEAGAKAYLVAPNSTVTLWDSESPTIYVKSADMNGVPSMRVLDFTERPVNAPQTPTEHVCKCGNEFIPKSELKAINDKFDNIFDKLEQLEEKYTALSAKPTKTTKTKTEE